MWGPLWELGGVERGRREFGRGEQSWTEPLNADGKDIVIPRPVGVRPMPPIQKPQRILVWSDVVLHIPTFLPIRATQENQGVAPGSIGKTPRVTRAAALWWWVAECAFTSRLVGSFCALGAADKASARVISSLGLLAVLLGQRKEISLPPSPRTPGNQR